MKQAKGQGVDLLGPDGLLNGFARRVLETGLDAEMTEHLGYEKHAVSASENARNGTRSKTVLTEVGLVQIDVSRDRDGSFDPKIVQKRRRRLTGVDEIVLSLTARGLTTGEGAAHFDDVDGASVSKDTISRITDKVIEEMTDWQNRPVDRGYPVVFIDALVVKVRDGQVRNKPFYLAVASHRERRTRHPRDLGGRRRRGREVLARGAHRDQEPWRGGRLHRCLRRPQRGSRNRSPLRGLSRRCRRASSTSSATRSGSDPGITGKRWARTSGVYTAPTEAAARERFEEFDPTWGGQYPAISKLWHNESPRV